MTSGIYVIHNKATDMRYIGASHAIELRWKQHINAMRRKVHSNSRLMSDWHTYGEDAFEFSILEVVEDIDMLAEKEFDYISLAQQDGSVLYNRVGSVGVGLIPHGSLPAQPGIRVSMTFSLKEIAQLKEIAACWYPGERNALSRTVRRIIRETYAREKAAREGSTDK